MHDLLPLTTPPTFSEKKPVYPFEWQVLRVKIPWKHVNRVKYLADLLEMVYLPGSGLYVDFRPGGSPPTELQRRSIAGTGAPSKRASPAGRRAARCASGGGVHCQAGGGSALEGPSARRQRPPMRTRRRSRWRHHLNQ